MIDQVLDRTQKTEQPEFLLGSYETSLLTYQDLTNMLLIKNIPEIILRGDVLGETDWKLNSDRMMSLMKFGGDRLYSELSRSTVWTGKLHQC